MNSPISNLPQSMSARHVKLASLGAGSGRRRCSFSYFFVHDGWLRRVMASGVWTWSPGRLHPCVWSKNLCICLCSLWFYCCDLIWMPHANVLFFCFTYVWWESPPQLKFSASSATATRGARGITDAWTRGEGPCKVPVWRGRGSRRGWTNRRWGWSCRPWVLDELLKEPMVEAN